MVRETVRYKDRESGIRGVKDNFLRIYMGLNIRWLLRCFFLLISHRRLSKKTNKNQKIHLLREDPDGLSDGLMTDWTLSPG